MTVYTFVVTRSVSEIHEVECETEAEARALIERGESLPQKTTPMSVNLSLNHWRGVRR